MSLKWRVPTLVKWLVGMPVAKPLQTTQLQQQIRTDFELQQPGCLWTRLQSRAEVCQFGWCFLQQEGLLSLSKSLVELKVSFNLSLSTSDLMHGLPIAKAEQSAVDQIFTTPNPTIAWQKAYRAVGVGNDWMTSHTGVLLMWPVAEAEQSA